MPRLWSSTRIGTENDDLTGLPGGVVSAYKLADQMSKARVAYENNIGAGKPVDGDLLQHYLVCFLIDHLFPFFPSTSHHPFLAFFAVTISWLFSLLFSTEVPAS
jgi:hypothetical protein